MLSLIFSGPKVNDESVDGRASIWDPSMPGTNLNPHSWAWYVLHIHSICINREHFLANLNLQAFVNTNTGPIPKFSFTKYDDCLYPTCTRSRSNWISILILRSNWCPYYYLHLPKEYGYEYKCVSHSSIGLQSQWVFTSASVSTFSSIMIGKTLSIMLIIQLHMSIIFYSITHSCMSFPIH